MGGVTELSRLTSDLICTADRRGEILMIWGRRFGTERPRAGRPRLVERIHTERTDVYKPRVSHPLCDGGTRPETGDTQ